MFVHFFSDMNYLGGAHVHGDGHPDGVFVRERKSHGDPFNMESLKVQLHPIGEAMGFMVSWFINPCLMI